MNIHVEKIASFDAIGSINETTENFNPFLENDSNEIDIPPETKFWGHCSNFQVWVEPLNYTKISNKYYQDFNVKKKFKSNMNFGCLKFLYPLWSSIQIIPNIDISITINNY